MASINVSEDDFSAVASAALDARDRGYMKSATALDKVARKINAALSRNHPMARIARMTGASGKPISWEDVPSVLGTND